MLWGRLILSTVLATATAWAADRQYQLHFEGYPCVIGPCESWEVTDRQTGERFNAVVDLSGIPNPPSSSNDLLAEARRVRRDRPNGGGAYETLTITRIIKAVPSVPGYRP